MIWSLRAGDGGVPDFACADETYDHAVNTQIAETRAKSKAKTFDELTATLDTWTM